MTTRLRTLISTEEQEAFAFMAWCDVARWRGWRISELILMIPNGAYLGPSERIRAMIMAKLKRAGFRNGICDYLLPIPVSNSTALTNGSRVDFSYPGLWIELKRPKGGRVSDDQQEFIDQQKLFGWKAEVCEGADAAKKAVKEYLSISADSVTHGY